MFAKLLILVSALALSSAAQKRFAYPPAVPATPPPAPSAYRASLQDYYRATHNQLRVDVPEPVETPVAIVPEVPPTEVHEYVASPVVHKFIQPIHVDKIVQPVVHHYYKRPIVHHTIESPSIGTAHTFTDYNTHHVHYLLKK